MQEETIFPFEALGFLLESIGVAGKGSSLYANLRYLCYPGWNYVARGWVTHP